MRFSFEKKNYRKILYHKCGEHWLSEQTREYCGGCGDRDGCLLREPSCKYDCEFGIRRLDNYACIGNTNPLQQHGIISFCNLFRRYHRSRGNIRRKSVANTLISSVAPTDLAKGFWFFFLARSRREHHLLLMHDLYPPPPTYLFWVRTAVVSSALFAVSESETSNVLEIS